MVTPITLTELGLLKTAITDTVRKKIAAGKTSNINFDINKNAKPDLAAIESLLNSVEVKLREAEMVFHTYLAKPDHGLLCGYSATLPFVIHLEFSYGANLLRKDIEVNDRLFYKELVDMNFRHFILLVASLYENIVALCEILIKKVILHAPDKRPPSTPLHDYTYFLETLVLLGYRKQDHLYKCITARMAFFDKYLLVLNELRNRFIHGYSMNLVSDRSNYKVIPRQESSFSSNSPELDLDTFSLKVLTESRAFFMDILEALAKSIKGPRKSIPS